LPELFPLICSVRQCTEPIIATELPSIYGTRHNVP